MDVNSRVPAIDPAILEVSFAFSNIAAFRSRILFFQLVFDNFAKSGR